jgi:hypothetical protein
MKLSRATREGGSSANALATAEVTKAATNAAKAKGRKCFIAPIPSQVLLRCLMFVSYTGVNTAQASVLLGTTVTAICY